MKKILANVAVNVMAVVWWTAAVALGLAVWCLWKFGVINYAEKKKKEGGGNGTNSCL